MKTQNRKPLWVLFLAFGLIIFGFVFAQTHIAAVQAEPPVAQRTGSGSEVLYLPLVSKPIDCSVPGANYSSLPIASAPTGIPAAEHPDINLAIRGYEKVSVSLNLVDYGGGTDANAPQLDTLFAMPHVPDFTNAYQIYRWDWNCDCQNGLITSWPTTLLGMGTTPGQTIHVPDSGYDIGGGNDVMVLYATENRITLKYTREDNIVYGYAVHIEDVCVDPALVGLYNSLNAAGRGSLPVLKGGEAFGRALGNEIKVSIRDTGNFLDPRSRKDWWQDY